MSDVLLLLGFGLLAAAGFLMSVMLGLCVVGATCVFVSVALMDDRGPWRRS